MNTRPKVTVAAFRNKKKSNKKITLLTAYDAPFASFLDQAGIDIVLVSDAIGTIANGRPEAVSVTVDEMVYHTRAVRNGVKSALIVTTLPFGSYNCVSEAVASATRIMKEGRADAVHLEGTAQSAEIIRGIVGSGIPVLGHIGFTKQQMVLSGTIGLPAKNAESSKRMINDAMAMVNSGVFGLIIECLPMSLGEIITRSLEIPVISIGSGVNCDGQGLVTQDMLGLYKELAPRFLKVYADLQQVTVSAVTQFRNEVESGQFPTEQHSYSLDDRELDKLLSQI
ncbi:MAG: 3-methyl-2-oxobutanoate hydroxymethyltransferase [bacterium]|nr:3-methyl-2-oxobutanoate hydroxymethyltransferase [bacterium]